MVAALVMIRLGTKRSLAEKTAFDAVLLIVLASALARAVNGSAAFFPTLGGTLVLVFMHRLFGSIGCRWQAFDMLIKGQPDVIVKNGNANWKVLRQITFQNTILRKTYASTPKPRTFPKSEPRA
jgi:uncharacterized membrane protein YcaP (DUF421 family)